MGSIVLGVQGEVSHATQSDCPLPWPQPCLRSVEGRRCLGECRLADCRWRGGHDLPCSPCGWAAEAIFRGELGLWASFLRGAFTSLGGECLGT